MATKIDLEQLVVEIRNLKPRQKLYIILRRELGSKYIDHWKQQSRGKYQKLKPNKHIAKFSPVFEPTAKQRNITNS
jgi:hypothetical protein